MDGLRPCTALPSTLEVVMISWVEPMRHSCLEPEVMVAEAHRPWMAMDTEGKAEEVVEVDQQAGSRYRRQSWPKIPSVGIE